MLRLLSVQHALPLHASFCTYVLQESNELGWHVHMDIQPPWLLGGDPIASS